MTPQSVSRLKLLGIALLALLPVVASYLLYLTWVPDQHTNYGELLEPTPLPSVTLALPEGGSFRFDQLRGRWILVTIGEGACPQPCEERLWVMRQVRRAQGKEASRIERVWLIDDAVSPDARLREAYAGTYMVRAAGSDLLNGFPARGSKRIPIYLIDPLGNLIMRYPADLEPKAMIKDLGRLLKYSRVG